MNIMNMFDMKDKISTILSRDNNNIMIGGGKSSYAYNIFKLLVGILLIITGLFVFGMRDYWKPIEATVINVYDNMNQCQVNITYTLDDIIYHKNIILPGLYSCNYNNKIDIYYYSSNPNIISLNTYNYFIFAISLISLGCISLLCVEDINYSSIKI